MTDSNLSILFVMYLISEISFPRMRSLGSEEESFIFFKLSSMKERLSWLKLKNQEEKCQLGQELMKTFV